MKKENLNKEDLKTLREKFIIDYCKKKGWNHNELTTSQMLNISLQKRYKDPKLV